LNHHWPEEVGLGAALLGWVAVYLTLSLVSASMALGVIAVPSGWLFPLVAMLAAALLVAVSFWLIVHGISCAWSARGVIIGMALALALQQVLHRTWEPRPDAFLLTLVHFGVGNVLLILFAMWTGQLVGGRVDKTSWVVPLLLVLAVVDCWSVFAGPTAQLVRDAAEDPAASDIAQQLVLWMPTLRGMQADQLAVDPTFGIGDLVVSSMLLEIARRCGLPVLRTAVALGVGLLVAPLVALSLGSHGVPALPFMGLAFLAVNARRIEWDRREILACVIFLAVLIPLLILVVTPLILPTLE
jgi:hypothetical protein